MANHPDPNNHPEQPDDPNKNPLPPSSDTDLGGTAEEHASEPTSSDSFVDLGMPGGPADPFASPAPADAHEASDLSIVEWAALVEEAPKSDSTAEAPQVDRPSDQDWAAKAAQEEKPTTIEPTVPARPLTDHAVNMSELLGDATDLMADAPSLGGTIDAAPQPPQEPLPDVPVLTDEDSEEQDSLAADLEVVRDTFNLEELDSHKTPPSSSVSADATPAPANLAPDDEDVFEEINRPKSSSGSGSFSSSGVDLQQLDSGSFENIVEEVAAEAAAPGESGSGVDLGSAELPKAPKSLDQDDADQPPSGRDLIAEAVESGVDMQQPLMEIAEEEQALEASEVVESSDQMKQPVMDIVEDEALDASEVVESSDKMQPPTMEIAEGEEALEAGEVVESSSSGKMKQPLLEIVEEQMAEEAIAAAAKTPAEKEESSAVNLGGPVETQKLNREELDALLAGQEMGAAAEPHIEPESEPAKPDPRKTRMAGRGPIRTTQMQEGGLEEVMEEAVEEEAAAVEAGDVVEEPAPPVEQEVGAEEVVLDDAAVGPDVSEIILRSDHPTIDSSEHLEELAGSGPHSGVLLDKLKAKEQAEVDPEEVQLGEAAAEEEEAPAAVGSADKTPPPKRRSPVLTLVGGAFVGLLIGVGACAGMYFSGLLSTGSGDKKQNSDQQSRIAALEKNLADAKTATQNAETTANATIAKLTEDKTSAEKDAKDAKDAAALLAADKKMADKMIDDQKTMLAAEKKINTELMNSNMKLADDKKMADKMIDDQKTMLAAEKKTNENLMTLNATLTTEKKKADAELVKAKADAKKLADDLQAEKDTVAKVQLQLKASQDIVNEKDPQGMIRKLQTEVNDTKATLKDRWEPQDMLATWLPVLEARGQKDLAVKAQADANRVLKDPKAKPEDKAKAQALIGLALRNDDKFDESKAMLTQAKKGLGANSAWLAPVDAALKEVSNPTATYLARVDTLRNKGDYDAAVKELTKTIDALPAEKRGELLAERSLLQLEAARAKNRGPLMADDPAVKAAQEDANKAASAGVPQGSYAVGRIAEELGRWPDAVEAYKKAVDATPPPLTAQSSRYRAALGNALLQSQGKAAPKDNKTGRLPMMNSNSDPRAVLAALVTLTLQPPLLPSASVEEANKYADEIINAPPGTVPFDVLSQAYVIKGEYTKALKVYAAGLKASKEMKPEYADGLLLLIETHPMLKRSESRRIANPLNAEKNYGAGLRWYWERNYAKAETEFQEAIANDGLDARYYYFLGLSRLAQNKPEAREDFAQGARLEAQERPSRAAVSAALERVQGSMRETLNAARRQAP